MKNILFIGSSYGIGLTISKELQYDNNLFIASRTNEEIAEMHVTHIPFDSITAQIASFLLSEKSSWISGQIFHADGGMSTLITNQ